MPRRRAVFGRLSALKNLLQLQDLDLQIESYLAREKEIPLRKQKYEESRKRLTREMEESEERLKRLQLEQRDSEGEIETRQEQIKKYDGQLLGVRKNEEYKALLHEIELEKKQIGLKEERILQIMEETDALRAQIQEDKERISGELAEIDDECRKIDDELKSVQAERQALEARRTPFIERIDRALASKYERIRRAKKSGPAAVPIDGAACTGCYMAVRPQIENEILAGGIHTCTNCGRLLFHPDHYSMAGAETSEATE